MNNEDIKTNKTIVNVGFCETNSEWLDRIINELANEKTNKINFDIICSQQLNLQNFFYKDYSLNIIDYLY